jgi:DNA-directed RNA polymerase specialized sigma24 family protein
MSRRNESQQLQSFNHQVLKYQDEIYTLAFYLTGDDRSASQAAQDACLQCFQKFQNANGSLRLTLLRQVMNSCRRFPMHKNPGSECQLLDHLSENERKAALLVDILGLTYEDALQVLDCSKDRLSLWLSQARQNLIHVQAMLVQTPSGVENCPSR